MSMVASDLEITQSPSCGPNNNLCLDTNQYSSPCPSYLSLNKNSSEDKLEMKINSSGIIAPTLGQSKSKKEEESKKNSNKTEKAVKYEQFQNIENGK